MILFSLAEKYENGVRIIMDWLGEHGVCVDRESAQDRADVCTGRLNLAPCPHNSSANPVTAAAGKALRHLVEIKNSAQLRVQGEKSLHACDLCLCYLPCKVWTPIAYIRMHMRSEDLEKYPDYCWQKKEIYEHTRNHTV